MSVEIVRLAARGEGVTADGRFVSLTAPGDLVMADGAIIPGPHHVTPPCRHFHTCGGCQLQHVDDAAFADFLVDRVAGALGAQGLAAPEIRPPHVSPPYSRRRAALRVERRGGSVLIGFNQEGSHRIVDLRECPILRPELFALVQPLRRLMLKLMGPRGNGAVRLTLADRGADMLLEGISAEGLEASELLTGFAAEHGLARLSIDDGYGPVTVWEPEPVTVTLGGTEVALPHDAFLQATGEGEAVLTGAVREVVGEAATVADLFAGIGTFALALPGRVYAAEGARDAVLALKAAAGRARRELFVEHRDLFRRPLTTAELDRFEAVVLDPPRAGARDQVAHIGAARVPRVAYVSCNPSTFARDAKTLIDGGYRLSWVQPVGQFRWSTHVELAAAFER